MRCQYVDPASGDRCDLGTPWRTTVRLETPPSRVWPREPGFSFVTWFCDEHQPDRDTLSKVLLAVRPSTIDLLINGQEEPGVRQVLKSVRIWSSTSSARRQRAGVEDVPLRLRGRDVREGRDGQKVQVRGTLNTKTLEEPGCSAPTGDGRCFQGGGSSPLAASPTRRAATRYPVRETTRRTEHRTLLSRHRFIP